MEDTRLESFPFDSKQSGYDDYGYPVYDRAVGASMLRQTFAKFFSNGVFDAPSNAFELSKGSGLKVNIAEGIAIINGAMASVPEGGIAVSLSDETTTAGTYAYGVFLRYDENSDKRSCYITVRKGEAGSSPTPPEPERSAPGIWELRLGYVVIPTGSSDLSGATVTNEKGLAYCPFSFPFEEIDLSSITADAKASATEAITNLLDYIDTNYEFIESAIDGTTAGNLQAQISDLKTQLENFDLSSSVDNETIAYGVSGGSSKVLYLMDSSVGSEKLKDSSVTAAKIKNAVISEEKLTPSLSEKVESVQRNVETIWSGETVKGPITLSKSVDEFDAIVIDDQVVCFIPEITKTSRTGVISGSVEFPEMNSRTIFTFKATTSDGVTLQTQENSLLYRNSYSSANAAYSTHKIQGVKF